MPNVEVFDYGRVGSASMRLKTGDTVGAATKFACMANLSGEAEIREIIKKCPETGESESIAIPVKMNLTLAGRFPVSVMREINGIENEGLKPGVYGYGPQSRGKNFVLTVDCIDEFEDATKKMAFPHVTNIGGFKFTVDNDADEYAYGELTLTANAVTIGGKKRFYVEAFVGDADVTITDGWASFDDTLVADPLPEA